MGPPWFARSTRDVVSCRGGDAVTFLSGQLSADVAGLAVGGSTHTFVLDPDGKVRAWGQLVRSGEDELLFVVSAGAGAFVVERLSRFLIRVDVDLTVDPAIEVIECRGAGAATAAAALGGRAIDLRWPAPAAEAVDVVDPDRPLPDGASLDAAAVERERVLAGVPDLGVDLMVGDIPAEGGRWIIDASVSFTKGCFVGQELVARVDSRGAKVPRRNCRLDLAGAVAPGAPAMLGDREVGRVTSVAGDVGLARLSRVVDTGMHLDVDGVDAVVAVDLGE